MEMQRPDFHMKVYTTLGVGTWLDGVNEILQSQIDYFKGGKYEQNTISIFPYEFFDPTKPADFDNFNYTFDLIVDYDDIHAKGDVYLKQVELARKIKAAFESLGCIVDEIYFLFMLPDGTSPNDLFE